MIKLLECVWQKRFENNFPAIGVWTFFPELFDCISLKGRREATACGLFFYSKLTFSFDIKMWTIRQREIAKRHKKKRNLLNGSFVAASIVTKVWHACKLVFLDRLFADISNVQLAVEFRCEIFTKIFTIFERKQTKSALSFKAATISHGDERP